MWLSDISIKKPIGALVFNLLLIIFGLIALNRLSLREYPDIDPPIITVETRYVGANAETVENRITKIIERQIAGINGIRFIESKSVDGASTIKIEFDIDRNIDDAANDVRERVFRSTEKLPIEAKSPEVYKTDSNESVIMWLNLTSNHMDRMALTDYAERYIIDKLSLIKGVARVRIGGAKRMALRVWLNPNKMASLNVTVGDIEKALKDNNIELPAGRIESKDREFSLWLKPHYNNVVQFENLVLKLDNNHLIRLKDIAKVEIGAENRRSELRGNRRDMVGLGVVKQSNANTLAVANRIKAAVKKIKLAKGMSIIQSYDTSLFIKAAIFEVYKTFAIALVLVLLVIYAFLGKIRAVIIPFVTIPISIISTFILLYAQGYSLNLMSLLGLVLAIGLVVDDAIVVLENITRRIDLGEPPIKASFLGTRQVGFAVIATTVVLLSIFLPLTILQGNVGRLFSEFAFTLASSVVFSTIVSLTLTPVMCFVLIKQKKKKNTEKKSHFFDSLRQSYITLLEKMLRFTKLGFVFVIMSVIASLLLFYAIPKQLVPDEDRGAFFIIVKGPEGASFEYMQKNMRQVEDIMMQWVDKGVANRALTLVPFGFDSFDAVNSGFSIMVLKKWHERHMTTREVLNQSRGALFAIPGIKAIPIVRNGLSKSSTSQPIQFVIGGSDYQTLKKWRDVIIDKAKANPGLANIDSDYRHTKPQMNIEINKDRAALLGISTKDIGQSLETLFAEKEVTTFIKDGEEYSVVLEANLNHKNNLKDLSHTFIRSSTSSQLIPLSNLIEIKETTSPNALFRFNRMKAITISASIQKGYSLEQGLNFFNQLAKDTLPDTIQTDYKGQAREFIDSQQGIVFSFILATLVMYLVLCAQFGDFIAPFIILLTAPLAILGALVGLYSIGFTLNIYSEIGLIMLIGLAAKNGILIVEFISQLKEQGVALQKAIIDATSTRLRPILMTALSTFLGTLPLIITSGAGQQSRQSIGIVIFFGISVATIFSLFIIPIAYQMLGRFIRPRNAIEQKLKHLIHD